MPEYAITQVVVAVSEEEALERWTGRMASSVPVACVRAIPLASCDAASPKPQPVKYDFEGWNSRMRDRRGLAIGVAFGSGLTGRTMAVTWSEALEIECHIAIAEGCQVDAAALARNWQDAPHSWPRWLKAARKANDQKIE